MAFLMSRIDRRALSAAALLAMVAALAGCVLFDGSGSVRRSYSFSHRVHVELDIGCTDCHLAAESADEPIANDRMEVIERHRRSRRTCEHAYHSLTPWRQDGNQSVAGCELRGYSDSCSIL